MAYEGGDCRECHQTQRRACRCSSKAAIDLLTSERDELLGLVRRWLRWVEVETAVSKHRPGSDPPLTIAPVNRLQIEYDSRAMTDGGES